MKEHLANEACAVALRTAADSGLRITELDDPSLLNAASGLLSHIWSKSPDDPLIATSTLRAMQASGNYVYGAFVDDELTAAIVGFLGTHRGALQLHSHVLGVAAKAQGRGVGFALKQHQRAWALARGIGTITWTFDPLVRRNAYFNIMKLGAQIAEYLPNFYGPMNDGINMGDDADRVLAEWVLTSPMAVAACAGALSEPDLNSMKAHVRLDESGDGGPQLRDSEPCASLLIYIPNDIVQMRAIGQPARVWRLAMREALGGALADGYVTVGMTRSGWCVLQKSELLGDTTG